MDQFRAGDWVEVKSKEEILRTLDRNGRLDELPFMPQMFQFCGRKFQIYKSAHKTCDTVTGAYVGRRLEGGIHLNLRCDGKAYNGCQAQCLLFWKKDWLKPVAVDASQAAETNAPVAAAAPTGSGCTEDDVMRATRVDGDKGSDTQYACQATDLLKYTKPLPWYDLSQFIEDYRTGNSTLGSLLKSAVYVVYFYGTLSKKAKLGVPGRWLYDQFQKLTGGVPYPWRGGTIPAGAPTPVSNLNLQPGEVVRVKSYEDILATIDGHRGNRGIAWDAEMVPFCGKTYRVQTRVERFINEKTGKMVGLRTPAVILEEVFCRSRYSDCRMHCPRSIYTWWREVWLERVKE